MKAGDRVRPFTLTALAALLGLVLLRGQSTPPKKLYTTWSDYGGAADSMQYSALKLINKDNVGKLELAWSYPVPDHRGNFGDGSALHRRGPFGGPIAIPQRLSDGEEEQPVRAGEDGWPGGEGTGFSNCPSGDDRRLRSKVARR